jgi:hypothetical protein
MNDFKKAIGEITEGINGEAKRFKGVASKKFAATQTGRRIAENRVGSADELIKQSDAMGNGVLRPLGAATGLFLGLTTPTVLEDTVWTNASEDDFRKIVSAADIYLETLEETRPQLKNPVLRAGLRFLGQNRNATGTSAEIRDELVRVCKRHM